MKLLVYQCNQLTDIYCRILTQRLPVYCYTFSFYRTANEMRSDFVNYCYTIKFIIKCFVSNIILQCSFKLRIKGQSTVSLLLKMLLIRCQSIFTLRHSVKLAKILRQFSVAHRLSTKLSKNCCEFLSSFVVLPNL